jgi:hypothetical protein
MFMAIAERGTLCLSCAAYQPLPQAACMTISVMNQHISNLAAAAAAAAAAASNTHRGVFSSTDLCRSAAL